MDNAYWLGIDFGTSGARAIALDRTAQICHEQSLPFASPADLRDPQTWKAALFALIRGLPANLRANLQAIALNGTSSTVLLCDAQGQPLLPPLLYNDVCDHDLIAILQPIVPPSHCVLSASSSLVKLLTFATQPEWHEARFFLHQADWLAFLLHGQLGHSDYHNSLKLGYDPATQTYPDWFNHPRLQPLQSLLPSVVPPGTILGTVASAVALDLELPNTCRICAGTTDSIAAFIASGATQPGQAVTSLGSTLVLKLLSEQRVDQADYGIYSHRLGRFWLVGGASNTGGAVLSHFFSPQELQDLSQRINPHRLSPFHYYPLLRPGERFPINDPDLPPRLEPRPSDPVDFLHGLLESLARIEAQGYGLLEQYGASPLKQVLTAGGGAQNETWQILRQRHLQVPVRRSPQEQAAYGTALLALRSTAIPST
ncbi:MAG: FGGY-family carbohydrate kinase [Thermosynechococcaceae cyanobacterium]